MEINRVFFKNRIAIVFLLQLTAVFIAQVFSIGLTSDFGLIFESNILQILTIILFVRAILLYLHKLHHGLWRYTSFNDIVKILKSTTLGSAVYLITGYFVLDPMQLLNALVVDWVFIICFLSGIRFIARLIRETKFKTKKHNINSNNQKRLLIVGAGAAGITLSQNIKQNKTLNYYPIAFVDDDNSKIGSYIQDIPVAGNIRELPLIISKFHIEKAIFAIPSASSEQKSAALDILNKSGVAFEILPSTPDVLEGNVSINTIRAVNPLDILGRPPSKLDSNILDKFIRHKCILITGAGGSVGSDLARQTSKYKPETLILLDQIENPLLFVEYEIKSKYSNINLITLIADVTDKENIAKIMSTYKPNIILHAAAHKHVPFMESNPEKAIKNNIGGTLTMALESVNNNAETFVFVSTDKAANPTSVMGTTKRVGELLLQQFNSNHEETNFVSVRFGNVFGSNASVVPIFKNQIESGGPVTVTHPEVTRYFMSIQEATGLILQAGGISKKGGTFVLDMGRPIKILDLANTLISIYGLQNQIDIKFTGLRPGEKLHEVLNSESEVLVKTGHSRISTIQSNSTTNDVISEVNKLLLSLNTMSHTDITKALQNIVPNYTPLS